MFATKRFGVRDRGTTKNIPEGHIQSSTGPSLPLTRFAVPPSYLVGCILVSLGIFTSATGGSWDITNHLLNKPETFFSPPHAVLYSGVASAVVGTVLVFSASRSGDGATGKMIWPVKLVIAGVVMLISAAPVDFGWHSAFGLDGLLSPP